MIKRIKYILLLLFISYLSVGCSSTTSTDSSSQESSWNIEQGDVELKQYGGKDEKNTEEDLKKAQEVSQDSILEVHYIDVGQGDSVLIKQGEHFMLIDAGNNDKGSAVWAYLLKQNVDVLDYAICTHPDADHIGGMDVVLYKIDCNEVFMPACENDTDTYEDLVRTIGQWGQKVTVPAQEAVYELGEAEFQILSDTEKSYGDNKNDYSIAIRLTFGENSFLLTGDAEEEAEQDMLSSGLVLQSDVYKASHHGASTANTEVFLTTVNPSYAVISCGEGNTYGHPRAEVLNRLRGMGVNVFRTDEQGTIVAVSDGTSITWNCSPSTTWKAGEPVGSEENLVAGATKDDSHSDEDENADSPDETDKMNSQGTDTDDHSWRYILNIRSMKIHYPHCNSVSQMSEKNKGYSNLSKEELMEQGYEPCGNCKP